MEDVLLEIVQKNARQLGLDGLPQLYQMIMDDYRPSFTHGIFLFAETIDNEQSSFKAASEMIEKNLAAEIFMIHQARVWGSPGYAHWVERLTKYIGEGRIRPIRANDPLNINTLTESLDLIRFAYEDKRKSFYLVAPPFHMLRAFMTAASVAIKHGSELNFYAYPGASQDLKQSVKHSQGRGPFPRWKWFELELESIRTYSNQKNIAPIPIIIKYMQNRKLKF